MFSTASGGSLAVRTSSGNGSRTATNPGAPRSSMRRTLSHRLASPRRSGHFIDGQPVATHRWRSPARCAPSPPATSPPSAATSSSTGSGPRRMRAPGRSSPRVFDASTAVNWQSITWVASTPAGASLAIGVRTGDSPTPDGTWSAFVAVAAPGALSSQSRYIQYRAQMSTADPNQTPALADISIAGSALPPTPPPPVTINIGDVMLAEGNSGSTAFTFPVTLSAATDHVVTVGYSTGDGTATVLSGDYEAAAGQLTFAPGTTGQLIPIAVSGDLYNEDDETFTVMLTSASGGTLQKAQGSALILNDDAVPSMSVANAAVVEGNRRHDEPDVHRDAIPAQRQVRDGELRDSQRVGAGARRLPGTLGHADLRAGDGDADHCVPRGRATRSMHPTRRSPSTCRRLETPRSASVRRRGTINDDDTSTKTFTTVADFSAGRSAPARTSPKPPTARSSLRPGSAPSSRGRRCQPDGCRAL